MKKNKLQILNRKAEELYVAQTFQSVFASDFVLFTKEVLF